MASEAARTELLEEFKAMTGTTDEFAISFLDSSDWKLEQAMELFLGGQGGVAQGRRSPGSSGSFGDLDDGGSSSRGGGEDMVMRIMEQHGVDRETALAIREAGGGGSSSAGGGGVDAEGVRAPILQKRARLFDTVEQEEGVGYLAQDMRGLTMAGGGSFDAQLHLARQMITAAAASGSAGAAEPQRPSLFAPPRWMMYPGTFEQARAEAKQKKRWLMVNLQDQQEFQSLVLNRDLWSDETTQSLIRESFVFWQQDRNAPEAAQFIHLYNPAQPFPHVCVIDPRTGERTRILKLKKKEGDLRESFFDQITEYLDVSTFDATPKVRPLQPAASSSSSSIPPASLAGPSGGDTEDKELAAAIQASLKVTEKKASVPASAPVSIQAEAPRPAAATAQSSKPMPTFVPLEPEPAAGPDVTTIQFKFPDGSKAKRRFAKANLVSMLFSYVAQSQKIPAGARFDLLTGDVPPRPLISHIEKTLVDADVLNQNLMVRQSE